MKFKGIITLCMCGAFALGVSAQTHVEGQEYFKADQFDNAKELLTRALNNAGTDKSVANYYLGMIAVEENKLDEAGKYFAAGVQANPDYAYNYVGQGLLKLKSGDAKTAEQDFKQADKLAKKDPGVVIAIARAYNDVDPVAYAKQIDKNVEKARKWNMQNPDIYIFEGDRFRVQKDAGKAAGMYEMAANYDKAAAPAYVKYASLFTRVNQDYAIKKLQELLSVNPNSALGQRELANAYYNKGDYANAAKQYAAYVNNPSHFKSDENRYAFLLFYGGDFQKGYDYATQRLKQNPADFTAMRYQFMNAAQIPALKDQYLTLAENLVKTHAKNPKENRFAPIDYNLISQELSSAKKFDEAVNLLEEGIKDNPDNAALNKQLAMIYIDASDTIPNSLALAAKAFKGYIDKTEEPTYNDYIQQATFLYYAGVQDKANASKYFGEEKTYLDKAAAAYPGFYKPNKMRGDIAKQQADKANVEKAAAPLYEQAIAEFETIAPDKRSNAAKSDAKEMYLYLGNYYLDGGDKAKAKQMFNKYLELDPNNAEVRKFADSL